MLAYVSTKQQFLADVPVIEDKVAAATKSQVDTMQVLHTEEYRDLVIETSQGKHVVSQSGDLSLPVELPS